MSAPVPPQSPTPVTPPPSSTPPGTPAGAPTPADFRFGTGADVPVWARGKTAAEVLNIGAYAIDTLQSAPTPAAPAAPAAPAFRDDDILTGADLRRALEAVPRDTAPLDLAATAVLGVAQQQFASDFAKWGGEISGMLARVPKTQWTLDNIKQVVRMVRADHVDEIANDLVTQRINAMEPTLRPNGSAAPLPPVTREHSLDADNIPQEWKDRARQAGINETMVQSFAAANGMTVQAFYEQFKTPMNRIVEEHGKGTGTRR
jgi:hypothetical protein